LDIFSCGTDRRCVGSALHVTLCEIPMPNFYTEAGEAEQRRQYDCRYDGNRTR